MFRFVLATLIFSSCIVAGRITLQNAFIETALDRAPSKENLLAAAKITTLNPEVESALGQMYQYSATDYDLDKAIHHYSLSLKRNSYDSGVWVSLFRAYETKGDLNKANLALKNAALASPASASVHWTYANFLVRNQENLEVREGKKQGGQDSWRQLFLSELHRTVELDPATLFPALDLARRAGIDNETIYHQTVPKSGGDLAEDRRSPALLQPSAILSLQLTTIAYFVQQKDFSTAALAWKTLTGLNLPLTMNQTLPYINALIGAGRIDEAARTWSQTLQITGYLEGDTTVAPLTDPLNGRFKSTTETGLLENRAAVWMGPPSRVDSQAQTGNLIFNPSFLRPPLNGGFDWLIQDSKETPIQFDPEVPFKSHHSLRLEFTGSGNLDFAGVYQYVPVSASTNYEFSAWMKSEGVSTDQGPFFEILDLKNPSGAWKTASLLGDHDWTEQHVSFTTGSATSLLLLRLRRLPSTKFDNLIRGKLWLGAVSLSSR